jgi:hypothetical protein
MEHTKYILLTPVKKVVCLMCVEYLPMSFKCRVEGEYLMWTVVVERHWLVRSATYVGGAIVSKSGAAVKYDCQGEWWCWRPEQWWGDGQQQNTGEVLLVKYPRRCNFLHQVAYKHLPWK